MPSYKDLLMLIRSGKPPLEIIAQLDVPPSRLRRMLHGKRLQAEIDLERQLASAVAGYKTTAGAGEVVGKLSRLTRTKSPETVRKVCLALLNEAIRSQGEAPEQPRGRPRGRPLSNPALRLQIGDTRRQPQTDPPESPQGASQNAK